MILVGGFMAYFMLHVGVMEPNLAALRLVDPHVLVGSWYPCLQAIAMPIANLIAYWPSTIFFCICEIW